MFAAGIAGDSGKDLLSVAIDQTDTALGVDLDRGEHVVGINTAVRSLLLPGLSGVVDVFVFLYPDLRFGEEIHAVSMVPVHVRDDHVRNFLWLDAEQGHRVRWLHEVPDLPAFEKLLAIEA